MKPLYDQKTNRLYPRLVLVLLESIILAGAGWLLLFHGPEQLNHWLHWSLGNGEASRNVLLFSMTVIVYLRMMATIFLFLKRGLAWDEAFSVSAAFALYYLGFPLLALGHHSLLNSWDAVYVLLFLAGSFLNTYSEWLRDRWKNQSANKGRLYTGGLFRYSMHINYFGDVLWVLALALITRNPWALLIPAFLFLFFDFYNIPLLDRHLEQKYGEAFRQYRKTTKRFIPFLY